MALTIASHKPIHETHSVVENGAVDADGHILEPPTLWEEYIDPQFRDRALRFRVDEHGLEELEIDGRTSRMSRAGFPSTLGAMGAPDLPAMQKDPARTYLREAPYGSMHPHERIRLLDAEHIDIAILYTTVGLLWEAEVEDPALSQAYTKAYNRWICEFCAGERRLVPTSRSPTLRQPRASWREPSAKALSAATSRRSITTARHWATPTTTRSSQPRKPSMYRWPSTPPSSRNGPRAHAWERGRT